MNAELFNTVVCWWLGLSLTAYVGVHVRNIIELCKKK